MLIEGKSDNSSGALAKIDFGYRSSPVISSAAVDLSKPIENFGKVRFEAGALAPGLVIPQGSYEFELELDASVSDDFSIQVISSEKNHLLGKVLTANEQTSVGNDKFFNKQASTKAPTSTELVQMRFLTKK